MKKTVKRKRKKYFKLFLMLPIAFFGIWFAFLKVNDTTSVTNDYDFAVPYKKRNISEYITLSGSVKMSSVETVYSNIKLPVKNIYCNVGDYVNEGDILCDYTLTSIDEQESFYNDMRNSSLQLDDLVKKMDSSKSDYSAKLMEIDAEKAALDVKYSQEMYDLANQKYSEYIDKLNYTSDDNVKQMYQSMASNYKKIAGSYQNMNSRMRDNYNNIIYENEKFRNEKSSAQYISSFDKTADADYTKMLENLNEKKAKSQVKAPKDGIICEMIASEGESNPNGEVLKLADPDNYCVTVVVSPLNADYVKEGMKAVFTTALTGDRNINGTVKSVAGFYNGNGYDVVIEIEDEDIVKQLRPNISAAVSIYSAFCDDNYAVQYDAVFEENGETYVYRAVKNKDGYIAEKVRVTLGKRSSFYIEVTDSELNENDMILGNASELSEGQRIRIRG